MMMPSASPSHAEKAQQLLDDDIIRSLQVEVISPVEDYLTVLKEVFDFGLLKKFLQRSDFKLVFDALHAVTGAYAHPILVEELGADASSIRWVHALPC